MSLIEHAPHALMFHDIITDKFQLSGFQKVGASQYTIDAKLFEAIIKSSITVDRDLVLTFDDGGSSVYNVISPIIEAYQKHAIFFISTSYINAPGFLTRTQIRELSERGHIIASHSHSHPRDISKLDYKSLVQEWSLSKKILEDIIGKEVSFASIPGGALSKNVLMALAETHYTTVYTSKPSTQIKYFSGLKIIGRYTVAKTSTPEHIIKILRNRNLQIALLFKYRFLRICKIILGKNYNSLKQSILKLF